MIARAEIRKKPFIGLFLRASEELVLVPRNCPEKLVSLAQQVLEAKPVHLMVNQSELVGLYSAMNSKGIVLPSFAEREEVLLLKKQGLNACLVSEKFSAIGNNVLVNDSACLINPRMPAREAKKIGDALGVEVLQQSIAGVATIGSINVVTNKGLLAYNAITRVELKSFEKLFKVSSASGSIANGLPFNSLGLVANSRGALVGQTTTGPELQRVYEALFS